MSRSINRNKRKPRLLIRTLTNLHPYLLGCSSHSTLPGYHIRGAPRLQRLGGELDLTPPRQRMRPAQITRRITRQVQIALIREEMHLIRKKVSNLLRRRRHLV